MLTEMNENKRVGFFLYFLSKWASDSVFWREILILIV